MCAAGGIGVCQGSVKCVGYLLLIGSQASAVVEKRLRKKIFTPAIPPYCCKQCNQLFHTGDCMGKDSDQIAQF